MSNLQVFNYQNKNVRTVEKDGQIWFVAKDVCDVLELTNPTEAIKSLDDDEKNTLRISEGIQQNRGNPNVNIISESGLYTLVMRSNKPEAHKFRKWVTSEVLPTLRKTGSYSIPTRETETKPPLSVANEILPITERILAAAGIKGNQLALALDRTAKHYTGVSMLELSGVQLPAPVKEQIMTPTEIGKVLGYSPRRVNEILAGMGYQHKIAGKWEPLEPGNSFAVMIDVGRQHGNGTPVRQLKWNSSIIQMIKTSK